MGHLNPPMILNVRHYEATLTAVGLHEQSGVAAAAAVIGAAL